MLYNVCMSKTKISDPESHFWSKVALHPTGCWQWLGYCDKDGYGKHWHINSQRSAHRLAYSYAKGIAPEGLLVCHTCDTPSCVRPSHLFLGTVKDNNLDKKTKGRAKGAHSGNRHHNAKYTHTDVITITHMHRNMNMARKEIAERFNMPYSSVLPILRGVWRIKTK